LFINAGQAAVTGVVNIDGNLFFESGVVSGQISVSKKGAAYLNAAGAKIFSGCNFVVQGPTLVSDVLMLNQSSVVTLSGATTASGSFSVQATDTTQVLFDVSAGTFEYSGPGFSVQAPSNFGTVTIGGNFTLYNTVQFAKPIVVPSGISISTVGTAAVSMTNGVTGAGTINAAGTSLVLGGLSISGYVNAVGGNVTIMSSSTIGTLTLAGGALYITGATNTTQLNLLSGILSGNSSIATKNFYLKGRGTVLSVSIVVVTQGYIGGGNAMITYGKHGKLTVAPTAIFTLSTLVINGAVTAPGFVNNGVVKVGTTFQTQNINVGGTGTFNVTGTLKSTSATLTIGTVNLQGSGVFTGTNSMLSVAHVAAGNSQSVQGTIGVYSFQCPRQCNSVSTSTTPTSAFSFTVGTQ